MTKWPAKKFHNISAHNFRPRTDEQGCPQLLKLLIALTSAASVQGIIPNLIPLFLVYLAHCLATKIVSKISATMTTVQKLSKQSTRQILNIT